jgi:DNA-binding beta-propeller fold protein YncE
MIATIRNDAQLRKISLSDLSTVQSFGSFGSGNDQFNGPAGIVNDGTYIYITDAGNQRVVKRLISDFSYVAKVGSLGAGNDQFGNRLGGLCSDGTYMYVVDTDNNRIVKRLLSDLSYVSKQGTNGSGNLQLYYPSYAAYYGGKIYIADTYNHRILIWNTSDLSYSGVVGGIAYVQSCHVDGTYLYIGDQKAQKLSRYLLSTLSYVDQVGVSSYTISNASVYLAYSEMLGMKTSGNCLYYCAANIIYKKNKSTLATILYTAASMPNDFTII